MSTEGALSPSPTGHPQIAFVGTLDEAIDFLGEYTGDDEPTALELFSTAEVLTDTPGALRYRLTLDWVPRYLR